MGSAGVGTALSAGASLFGALGGNNVSNTFDAGAANAMLGGAMNNALSYSSGYTNQAVAQQNQSLNTALGELNQAMTSANNTLTNSFNQSQALQEPYRDAGYRALDTYEDSLHMSRAKIGNQAVAQALGNQTQLQNQMSQYGQTQANLNAMYNPNGTLDPSQAPNAPTLAGLAALVPKDKIDSYIAQNTTNNLNEYGQDFGYLAYSGVGALGPGQKGDPNQGDSGYGQNTGFKSLGQLEQQGHITNAVANMYGQEELPQAQGAYNQGLLQYNNMGQYLQNNYTPQMQGIANAYNAGLFNNLGTQALYSK